MKDWQIRTETRYKNADTKIGKFIFGSYKTIFKTNTAIVEKTTGFVEIMAVTVGDVFNTIGIKNNILERLVKRKVLEEQREINKRLNRRPHKSFKISKASDEGKELKAEQKIQTKTGWRRVEPTWKK